MAENVIIANIISFVAAIFLVLSCVLNDRKKVYFFQLMESATLCVTYVFLGAWTGCITMIMAVCRNVVVLSGKYTKKLAFLFAALTAVVGISVNREGIVGLMPIAATVELTVCNYYAKSPAAIKLSFIGNIIIYVIYSFLVQDYSTAVVETVTGLVALVSLVKLLLSRKHEEEQEDGSKLQL